MGGVVKSGGQRRDYREVINCGHERQQPIGAANMIFPLIVDLVQFHTLTKLIRILLTNS